MKRPNVNYSQKIKGSTLDQIIYRVWDKLEEEDQTVIQTILDLDKVKVY